MKKTLKKSVLIVIILVITIIGLVSCNENKIEDNNKVILDGLLIENEEARVLDIKELDMSQIANKDFTGTVVNRIENISNFNISEIWIIYNELNKDGKIISESKMLLDMTLMPGDVFKATFKLKESSEDVNIISYEYTTLENTVLIGINDGIIKVREKLNKVENSSDYEVLEVSQGDIKNESKDGDTYIIKVKSNSLKNLGNIVLKIAEIDSNGDYIKVNHEPSYSALGPSEEAEITVKASKRTKKIKVIGYVYDDIDTKSNIDIDLEANEAKISNY